MRESCCRFKVINVCKEEMSLWVSGGVAQRLCRLIVAEGQTLSS